MTANKSLKKKLNTIQNEALRLCTGAFRTSPVISLQAEVNIEPLEFRRYKFALSYYTKLANKRGHSTFYKTFFPTLEHKYKSSLLPLGPKCKKLLEMLQLPMPTLSTAPPSYVSPWIKNHQSTIPSATKNCLKQIKIAIHQLNSDNWQQVQPSNNKLRSIKAELCDWKTSNRVSRREEVVLTRLRIGHTNFTHLSLITEGIYSSCELCGTPLTIKHIIISCPKYKKFRPSSITEQTDLSEILGDDEEKLRSLFSFLRKAGIYNRI